MPDTPRHIFEGPDQYWSPDLAPSRSQLATIAHLSARLLGLPVIASRLDASITIARLHAALEQHTDAPPRRDPGVLMLTPAIVASAREALNVLDHQAAEQLVEHAAVARLHRRRRPARIAPRRMRQCLACRAFTTNPSRPCKRCGYLEGAGYVA